MMTRCLLQTFLAGLVLVTITPARPQPLSLPENGWQTDPLLAAAENQPSASIQDVQGQVEEVRRPDVIFVPTPQDVVEAMLEVAKVTKNDLVYDLGCGDGRIVVTAAKKYGARAVGYDVDPQRIKESLENVEKNNVGDLVQIEQKDIFTLDLSDANVVTLYLLRSLNNKLVPQLEKLKPGSRIVSHDFEITGAKPDTSFTVISKQDSYGHDVYFWTIPFNWVEEGN